MIGNIMSLFGAAKTLIMATQPVADALFPFVATALTGGVAASLLHMQRKMDPQRSPTLAGRRRAQSFDPG